ncbi:hypothetical protein [Nicoliella spurrieriana]|nr:hypothetical protein [Nicoliella spurrieriana]
MITFNHKPKPLYFIVGLIDTLIIFGIIISLIVTDGEYFWGIVSLTLLYILMILAASVAQAHNHNGIFNNPRIHFTAGFIFNLFFLFINPI